MKVPCGFDMDEPGHPHFPCDRPLGHDGEHCSFDYEYTCDCGQFVPFDEARDGGEARHEATREHIVNLIQRFDTEDWARIKRSIENGLGWANSESMGSYEIDDDTVLRAFDELVLAYRASAGVPA